ncbi:S8 family peptidase [Limnofasciculus baicalensis]|uniref:S8 family peptidase n=1 Tax=Limnofasciculus baicalensis BBK-W-15 TaxID=2699891 RepID=A0AAE3KPK2_9CYAN|nr:S8 family peptidase [Limnofasciculus baicalensis]MCP2729733.1 S8 family peptidase [Limnofasciculus baicalensis BBK-W-15]
MVKSSDQFPHIQLKLKTQGIAASPPPASRKQNPQTAKNLSDRWGHGRKLRSSIDSLVSYWQDIQEQREEEGKPPLPEKAKPIILQIDPNAFDADDLRKYGIEVISEVENGYIIGASANDPEFSELQKKLDKFIQQERGGNKIAEIWDILDGSKRPEYILSPELLNEWDKIRDEQIYRVDVGIACIGTKSQLPNCPKRNDEENDEKYTKRINTWINKRDITYQEWDSLKSTREDELTNFVNLYQGDVINIVDGSIPRSAELSDSFSCRIQISGKGLKDLVFNFPYIFDVSEPDEFAEIIQRQGLSDREEPSFTLEPPEPNAPKVCVIDSGIQERHSLLKAAIDSENSRSWIPGENDKTADYVSNGGHGTRVAGAVLYPSTIPRSGKEKAVCWLQNARVLDANSKLSKQLFPPNLLGDIVGFYHSKTGTRIFNHSITGSVPCRTQYMSAWAAAIDQLTWNNDILFIVAAGNLPLNHKIGFTRLSVRDHLVANRVYPDYLLEDSCRVANPAQSFQSLTVGSIALNSANVSPWFSIGQKDRVSAFSCCGLGIWETIKPEVVEYGGYLAQDGGVPPNITYPKDLCPELVRSTLNGGPAIASDAVGTSFAAPKVSHIAACLAGELPDESCLLYRALIVQSARWPEWTKPDNVDKLHVLRQIGYGIPNLDRALGNAPNRITLITRGEQHIKARQAHIYQVKLPEKLRSQGEELEILLEVTLSYKAQPRRTRRNRRKYLSTWLDWDCSKRGEDPERFLARTLAKYDAPENSDKGESIFKWMLGKQNNYGKIKEVSRSTGTLQKDWTVVKSFELTEAFCIAIVGHEGWNNEPEATVPYSLLVSFEAVEANIPIYAALVEAQIELVVEQEVEIQALGGS